MISRQIYIALPIYVSIFIVQESVINQFRLPGGGFSILLILTLVLAILSQPEVAALGGFIAGVLMDLSSSSSGPIGQWSLLMIAASYAISYFGSGNEGMSGSPIGSIFLITTTVFLIEVAYLVTGALLGVQTGGVGHASITIAGITIWSLVTTPILLPVFSRLHALIFNARSAI